VPACQPTQTSVPDSDHGLTRANEEKTLMNADIHLDIHSVFIGVDPRSSAGAV
jgi:hypothetical protein